MLGIFGLTFIAVAWVVQLFSTSKRNQKINPIFILSYIVGVFMLTWDGLVNGSIQTTLLNLFCLVAAGGTYWKLKN